MSMKSMSPPYKRRSRSHSPGRNYYRSHKRSYSPGDRSPSPLYKTPHRSTDRYETQHYESYRRPYMRFSPRRPFFDRGRSRFMRRPSRGFPSRNFRFNPRYRGQHTYQFEHKDREYQTSPVDRSRRRSFTPSPSRSRMRSPSPPPRRRSVTPESRRISRSLSPSVSSSTSARRSKSPSYKAKDLEGSEIRYRKQLKERSHSGKALRGSSKSRRSRSPEWPGRSVSEEAKLTFSREDLEKITVDVQCSVNQEPCPIVREIINPDEIRIVRRDGEGHRPLFARVEIQSTEFEEEIAEKSISVKGDPISESQADPIYQASGKKTESIPHVSLKKHWEQDDASSASSSSYTRTRKRFSGERVLSPAYDERRSVSPSRGKYSRTSSVRDPESHRKHDMSRSYNRHSSGDQGDLRRHSQSSRHKDDVYDDRSDFHHTSSTSSRKHYNGELGRSRSRSRSRSPLTTFESQLRGRSETRLPDFSQRPDRYKYDDWTEKPEHDFRDHGGTRPFRSRGFRPNRFFRPRRGGYVPRSNGTYTRRPFRSTTGYIPRSRGFFPR